MGDELRDWLQLAGVIVPVGGLITLMVYIRGMDAGRGKDDIRQAIAWIWLAIVGSTALLIVGRTIVGGPLIEVDTLSRSIHFGDISAMHITVLVASLIVVVAFWAIAFGRLRRVMADGPSPAGEQEEQTDAVD